MGDIEQFDHCAVFDADFDPRRGHEDKVFSGEPSLISLTIRRLVSYRRDGCIPMEPIAC